LICIMCINFAFGLVILKQMEYNNIRRIADINTLQRG